MWLGLLLRYHELPDREIVWDNDLTRGGFRLCRDGVHT